MMSGDFMNHLEMIYHGIYWKEIMHQLLSNGIKQDKIINLGKDYLQLNYLQYFELPELLDRKFGKEVFIDGGCYDGGTSMNYVKWLSNNNILGGGGRNCSMGAR